MTIKASRQPFDKTDMTNVIPDETSRRERGASAIETGFLFAMIAVVAIGALSAVGTSTGGEDIETATLAMGGEAVDVNEDSPDTATASNGAGGSSGSFGSAAVGVSNTNSNVAFQTPSNGSYWNTRFAGEKIGDDWEVVSGSVDAQTSHNGNFDFGIEGQFMDLNGHGAGHIRRTVDVIPGAQYNLSLDIGENADGGPDVKQMEIIWNGVVVSTLDVDLPRNENKTFTVQLPPSLTGEGTLEFRSTKSSAHGPVIDNTTLTLIPNRN